MPTLLILQKSQIESLSLKAKQIVGEFFTNISNTPIIGLEFICKMTDLFIKEFGNINFQSVIANYAINNNEFFEKFYPQISDEIKRNWLVNMIAANQFERLSEFIKIQKKVPSRQLLIDNLLQKASQGFPAILQNRFLD